MVLAPPGWNKERKKEKVGVENIIETSETLDVVWEGGATRWYHSWVELPWC